MASRREKEAATGHARAGPARSRPSAGSRSAAPADAFHDGVSHLRGADPVMKGLVEAYGPLSLADRRRGRPPDAFGALVRSIVGQQLSTKAARSIYGRLAELFDGRSPDPESLAAADARLIRSAGLSGRKVEYLRDLAAKVRDGEVDLARLAELPDEDVTAELTRIKGLGPWTADMFMIFHLRRPDVLAVGDLGTRSAVRRAYGLPELPGPTELRRIAEPWRPHRSLACLYLWKSLDAEPVT